MIQTGQYLGTLSKLTLKSGAENPRPPPLNTFNHTHDQLVSHNWYDSACQKSSLDLYIKFKKSPYLERYLLDKLDFLWS